MLGPSHASNWPLVGRVGSTAWFCNAVTVVAPVFAMLTSPLRAFDSHVVPFAIRIFLSVTAVDPSKFPLILSTEVVPCGPETSPARLPVKPDAVSVVPEKVNPPPRVISEAFAAAPVGLPTKLEAPTCCILA